MKGLLQTSVTWTHEMVSSVGMFCKCLILQTLYLLRTQNGDKIIVY